MVRAAVIVIAAVLIAGSFSAGRDATRYTLVALSVIGMALWCRLGAATELQLVCIAPFSFCVDVALFNLALIVDFPLSRVFVMRWVQVIELHGAILTISSALLAFSYLGAYTRRKSRNHESAEQ